MNRTCTSNDRSGSAALRYRAATTIALVGVSLLSFIGVQAAGQQVAGATGYTGQTTIGTGFSGPRGVAVDGSGNVFVADTDNSQIVKMKADGSGQTPIGTGFS